MNTKELYNLKQNLHKYKSEIFRPEFEEAWEQSMDMLIDMALEKETDVGENEDWSDLVHDNDTEIALRKKGEFIKEWYQDWVDKKVAWCPDDPTLDDFENWLQQEDEDG